MTATPLPPSGKQIEIAHGEQRAVVVEAGGGLRAYSSAGRDLLHGYGPDESSSAGRGQLLIPWPNRIKDGSYEFDGRRHQLPIDDVAEQDAIHGLTRWAAWALGEREPHRVVMEHHIHPRPGYPFSLALGVEYVLSDDGLRVMTAATNMGAGPCPYGCGAHPYLQLGTGPVDSLVLTVPARTVLWSDERGIPVGSGPVEGTELDFRRPRPIDSARLDNAFTDLERDDGGVAVVSLEDPDSGDKLALWVDHSYPYLMVFTGDPPTDVERRGLAVEPMTCPPDAFRSGESLIRLDPGQSFTSTWGIRPS
jgi:aldose 1-epimerase